LEHPIDFLDSLAVHPVLMVSEAAAETDWDVKEFMDKGLLLFLRIEEAEALRDHLYHIAGLSPEGELPQPRKPMDTSQSLGRL